MKELVVYLDESGNVGDVAGDDPFGEQPTFAVAALAEERGSGAVASVVAELANRHRFQPGEISARRFKKKPTLMTAFIRALLRAGVVPFVELMDKRFYVANNIVTWFLSTGWRDFSDETNLTRANALAEELATRVGDAPLLEYARFAKVPSRETFNAFVTALRGAVRVAKLGTLGTVSFTTLEFMGAAIEHALESSAGTQVGDGYERFLQPPDVSSGGHRLGLLPHVQAFSNLCARLNAFTPDCSKVVLMHDEQKEFGAILSDTFATLVSNAESQDLGELISMMAVDWRFPPGKFELAFVDSAHHVGVQAADVLAGFCTRRLNDVVVDGRAEASLDEAARLLGDVTERAGVNFTTTWPRLEAFVRPRRVRLR